MDRKAIARTFAAGADARFDIALNPFQEIVLVAVILDGVTIWARQLLAVTVTNPG
jgi:hypothetical protein